jgi:hypothetical protein
MTQTYSEKQRMILNFEVIEPRLALNLGEYHSIIEKQNVIIAPSPTFCFNLLTFEVTPSVAGEEEETSIILTASTKIYENFRDFKVDNDFLYFFYNSWKEENGNYHLRYTKIPVKLIEKIVEKRDALRRTHDFMNTGNLEEIRNYINSEKYENDLKLASFSNSEILKEAKLLWKTYLSRRIW